MRMITFSRDPIPTYTYLKIGQFLLHFGLKMADLARNHLQQQIKPQANQVACLEFCG